MLTVNSLKKSCFCFCLILSLGAHSGTVSLNMSGLEDLGPNARYEGWLMVSGSPVSTGVFSVDGSGVLSQTVFNVSDSDAEDASTFILTIEPFPDIDPSPANSHLLAGDINAGLADINVGHPAAIGDDLTASIGRFVLTVPTAGKGADSFDNGIWFVESAFPIATATAGLNLPTLPVGWVYEGWVVDESVSLPISIGTFSDENSVDSDGAGPTAGLDESPYLVPGQDFVVPPRNLSINHTAVISVEPVPDNSSAPFTLMPLQLSIGSTANSQLMNNNALATNPFGQVSVSGGGQPANVESVPTTGYFATFLLFFLSMLLGYKALVKKA